MEAVGRVLGIWLAGTLVCTLGVWVLLVPIVAISSHDARRVWRSMKIAALVMAIFVAVAFAVLAILSSGPTKVRPE